MSDVTLLTGAAIFLGGMVAGRTWPARRRKQKPKQVGPTCGCEHVVSYHEGGTGRCHAVTGRRERYHPVTGANLGYHDVECTCQGYSGPEPLPEYYAPEIGSSA